MKQLFAAGAVALLAALPALREASAEEYPSQDIRLICGFPPGSGADVLVRFFAEKLRPIAGRTVIVENKPGAASNIATQYVAKSKPDGHTIYPFALTTVAASMHLFKKPPVDVAKELRAVAGINRQPFMLTVDAKSPFKTVAELTEAVKKKGEATTYGVSANPGRIMGALYKDKTGIVATEVVYRSSPDSLNEMTNGRLDYGLFDPVYAMAQVRQGRLRALAVSTAARMESVPEIPTMTESGIPMNLELYWGVMVPAATPDAIANKINGWFAEILKQPDTIKLLADSGADPLIRTPAEAQGLFLTAIKDWGEFVKKAGIEPQ
jgi:tripartite-type tricarboxylate transporter receptor subunit TctC